MWGPICNGCVGGGTSFHQSRGGLIVFIDADQYSHDGKDLRKTMTIFYKQIKTNDTTKYELNELHIN